MIAITIFMGGAPFVLDAPGHRRDLRRGPAIRHFRTSQNGQAIGAHHSRIMPKGTFPDFAICTQSDRSLTRDRAKFLRQSPKEYSFRRYREQSGSL
jgi:hypothetical protein